MIDSTSHPHVTVEAIKYLRLFWGHWRLIGIATFVAMAAVGTYDKFFATRYYQATATITPVPPSDYDLGLNGGISGMLGGGGGGGDGGGLTSLLSGGTDNEMTSENYVSIMNSYDFTMNLVKRYHLLSRLITKEGDDPATMTPWNVYQEINGSFDTDYDYKSGNLVITFIDSDPAMAREVLGYYLQSLQDKLRAEEMNSASVAANSLHEEVSRTSDSLLQQQLYQLMAYQIQREKLAQMQANFAFKMIEPPMTTGLKYSPNTTKTTLLTGAVVILAFCVYLTLREWFRAAEEYRQTVETAIPFTDVSPLIKDDLAEMEKAGRSRFR